MIRRYNYTSRKKIERGMISVTLHDGEPATFEAEISLDGLNLPEDADLTLVANRAARAQRFQYGKVGAIVQPEDRTLTEIGGVPSFRLLVVEAGGSGRLLAVADRISPRRADGDDDGLQSLLWVQEADIGDEVWRMNFSEGDPPMLYLNQNIPGISEAVRSDEKFRSLIVPEAFRSILQRMILVEKYDPEDGELHWADWIRIVQDFQPTPIPQMSDDTESNESIDGWIDETVELFVNDRFNASELYRRG